MAILFPHVYLRRTKVESYQFENIQVIPEKKGFQEFSKVSYPIRYGRFSEIQTPDYTFQFNYNSVFLGLHDALMTETALIEFSALKAHHLFDFERSHIKNPCLFLFGSVDSLLDSEESKFRALNQLPFKTYLNLGLESVDPETLAVLKKPITSEKVKDAFTRMIDINKKYARVEVSVNFILGEGLPPGHLPSLLELIRNCLDRFYSKGAVYLSPLIGSNAKGEMLKQFYKV